MSLRYTRRLLEHLKHDDYTPRKVLEVARDLAIPSEELPEFEEAVQALARQKLVHLNQAGNLSLPSLASRGGEITGTFRRNPRGFGFVEPSPSVKEGSVFVGPEDTLDALTGDTVRVALEVDRRGGGKNSSGFVGVIVEVVKRKRSNFAGELFKRGDQWLVAPDGRELTEPIVVRDATSKNAREGDKVIVEILAYPQPGLGGTTSLAEGVITKVLGDAGRPDVETQAVIAAYDLPGEFPEECVDQAREATQSFDSQIGAWREKGASSLTGRIDLTKEFIITIDPPDAKDYDDAISIKRTADGWELGVHIADVAHFIEPGSPLDVEAKDRANSCYLPRLVIPMLPEILSNGICSLQEGVPRFCKSAFMTYNRHGEIKTEGVAQTLIQSAKRLTYLEAQALIDGDLTEARRHAKTPPKYSDQLLEAVREMNELARQIQARRDRQGMIVLDLPEVELVYDEHGRVVDAEREDDAFTHKLIEMFMVEANEVLARLFENLGVPLLRRIHPDPVPGDVDEMRKAALVAGFRIPKAPSREELQGLLKATHGTPAARAVHMAVLRTLSKAEYSPALIGHFALASEAYAHFTSPIRRYADLTVHRALAEYLRKTDNGTKRPKSDPDKRRLGQDLLRTESCPPEEELVEIGRHATRREENAEAAERELRSFLVLQLLAEHIGESYSGVVTGVNPRGVFIQIDKFLADGFIKAEDLPGDTTRDNLRPFWKVDQKSGALVDQRSGRSFNFGDLVTVKIANVDLAQRKLDLVIADDSARAAGKRKNTTLGLQTGLGGGMSTQGAGGGFPDYDRRRGMSGGQRRSQKSKSRDKRKGNRFRDR
ncbi:MAG: ribonuclease R family protein [Phycisphaerales bacterium]